LRKDGGFFPNVAWICRIHDRGFRLPRHLLRKQAQIGHNLDWRPLGPRRPAARLCRTIFLPEKAKGAGSTARKTCFTALQ
jgi:hypothetical protein